MLIFSFCGMTLTPEYLDYKKAVRINQIKLGVVFFMNRAEKQLDIMVLQKYLKCARDTKHTDFNVKLLCKYTGFCKQHTLFCKYTVFRKYSL